MPAITLAGPLVIKPAIARTLDLISESVTLESIVQAHAHMKGVIDVSPLEEVRLAEWGFEELDGARLFYKREDCQPTRAFKERGARNFLYYLSPEEKELGSVAASTGNYSQGFSRSCSLLGIPGMVFMPHSAPKVKQEKTLYFGNGLVKIQLIDGDFDAACDAAKAYAKDKGLIYAPPFDHPRVIAGQATTGKEIYEQSQANGFAVDYIFVTIGGGGLIGGVAGYYKQKHPHTKIIGVESENADAMTKSVSAGRVVELDFVDRFVDGAAVRKVSELTLGLAKRYVDDYVVVPNRQVAKRVLDFYDRFPRQIVEPAGALPLAGLDEYIRTHPGELNGKNIVCIVSGGNLDLQNIDKYRAMIRQL